ncbi:tryptophan ABC transporter substrate-binding protein [Enterococcus sp. LJL120]
MKNKGLIASVAVIAVILVGFFAYQLGQQSNSADSTADSTTESSAVEMKTVGILQYVSHNALDQIHQGIIEGLAESGYVEGENLTIEFQNGQADQSRLNTMSQQLISEGSDVLVGIATPAAQALANATTEIPIVLGAVTDPVGAGLVADLDEPGGNITGVSDQTPVAAVLQLAQEILPEAATVGILYSSAEDNSQAQVAQAQAAAADLGVETKLFAVNSSNEIAQTVQVMAAQVDYIFIPLDNTIANAMETVVQEADAANTPIFPSVDTMVEQGGIATIGLNQFQIGVETGKMAAQILDGADPAATPVYLFTEGETIINSQQAAKLGITIPADIVSDATDLGGEE